MTPWERVLARCQRVGDCLVWKGVTTRNGYGQIRVNGRKEMIHRVAYEHFNGPIPVGLVIDHVKSKGCRFLTCCEPTHLEATTQAVNVERGDSPFALNARKTHCPEGASARRGQPIRWRTEPWETSM